MKAVIIRMLSIRVCAPAWHR